MVESQERKKICTSETTCVSAEVASRSGCENRILVGYWTKTKRLTVKALRLVVERLDCETGAKAAAEPTRATRETAMNCILITVGAV
jgi:hypothetical protein